MAGDPTPSVDEMPFVKLPCSACGHERTIMFGHRPIPHEKIEEQLVEALGDVGRGTGLPETIVDVVLALVDDGPWTLTERIPPARPEWIEIVNPVGGWEPGTIKHVEGWDEAGPPYVLVDDGDPDAGVLRVMGADWKAASPLSVKPIVHIDADLPEGVTATTTVVAWDIDPFTGRMIEGTWIETRTPPPGEDLSAHCTLHLDGGPCDWSTAVANEEEAERAFVWHVDQVHVRRQRSEDGWVADHEHDWRQWGLAAHQCELCRCSVAVGLRQVIWPPNHHEDENLSDADRTSLVESAIRRYERKAWTTPDQGEAP